MFTEFIMMYVALMKKSDIQKVFGLRLRALRTQNGLSQEELAELASLHWTYISSIERGERNVSLYTIVILSQALNCSTYELIP